MARRISRADISLFTARIYVSLAWVGGEEHELGCGIGQGSYLQASEADSGWWWRSSPFKDAGRPPALSGRGRANIDVMRLPGAVLDPPPQHTPDERTAAPAVTAPGCPHWDEMLPLHRDAPVAQRCSPCSEMLPRHRDAPAAQRCSPRTEMLPRHRDAPPAQRCSHCARRTHSCHQSCPRYLLVATAASPTPHAEHPAAALSTAMYPRAASSLQAHITVMEPKSLSGPRLQSRLWVNPLSGHTGQRDQ